MQDIMNQMMNPNAPEEKPLKAPKRETASKDEQMDVIKAMAIGPTSSEEDNTVAEVKPNKEEKKMIKEKEKKSKEDIVSLVLSGKTVGKKYREKLIDQATQDPESVGIKVGDKWKTVKKAMQDGDLGDMPKGPDLDKLLAGLDPEMRARMMSMLNPKTTDASPEQLKELGMGAPGMGTDFMPQANPNARPPMPPQPGQGAPAPQPGQNPADQLPPEVLAAAQQGGIN